MTLFYKVHFCMFTVAHFNDYESKQTTQSNYIIMQKLITLLVCGFFISSAQSQSITPREITFPENSVSEREISSEGDTITFSGHPGETIITDQYQEQGFLFSGFDGSTSPVVADYGNQYGRVLRSSDWYSGIRIDFVQSQNPALNVLVSKIEFDNKVAEGEIDYVAVKVYDSDDQLIHHYVSISPEHVIIQLTSSSAAYFTVDDSLGTAYILDNFHVDGLTLGINEEIAPEFSLFPNPSSAISTIKSEKIITDIKVITLQGQLVFHSTPFSKTSTFEIENNGLYLVSVSNGDSITTKKLVVNH